LSSFASTWAAGYDGNGNLTSRTNGGNLAYSYSYDDENQLISVVYQDPAVANSSWWRSDFVYDGRGRLRQRQDYTWYGGTPPGWITGPAINYIYDGMRVIQERDAFNTPTVSYTRGSDMSGTLEGAGGIGGLLARSHGYSSGSWTNHNYYHADGNGNITYLVNSSQSVAASYRYDPFGNPVSTSGTLASANTYRFSSKERHPNSGMYYYGYRFYDPNLQRWLNRDPIRERGFKLVTGELGKGVVEELSLYGFIRNGPLNAFDAFGLQGVLTGIGMQICCGVSSSDAEQAMQAGLSAADQTYPGRDTVENRAMRHCVASAILAVRAGCPGSECVGTMREDLQTNHGGQPPREGQRGKNNNRVGRNCAGCKGPNADTNPWRSGHGRNVHYRPTTTLDQIMDCCHSAIDNGTGGIDVDD